MVSRVSLENTRIVGTTIVDITIIKRVRPR